MIKIQKPSRCWLLGPLATAALGASLLAPGQAEAATERKYHLVLISLECIKTEDNGGADEPYLRVDGIRVWGPGSLNNSDSADLHNMPVSPGFDDNTEIKLWDDDREFLGDHDDFLGAVTATAAMAGQEQTGHFNLDGAEYNLRFRVVHGPPPPVRVLP